MTSFIGLTVFQTGSVKFGKARPEGSVNKAGYTANLTACGWAGAVLKKVTRAYGQEPYAQKAQKHRKSK